MGTVDEKVVLLAKRKRHKIKEKKRRKTKSSAVTS